MAKERKTETMAFRIKETISGYLRMRSGMLGISYSEYISLLVQKDMNNMNVMEICEEIQRLKKKLQS
jgi:hypothetical protein